MSERLQRYALISEIAGAIAVVLSVGWRQLADNNPLLRSQARFNASTDDYYRFQLRTMPVYARFWKERQVAFAEPFKSYVTALFASAK